MKGWNLAGVVLLLLAVFYFASNTASGNALFGSLFGGLRENLRAFQGRDPRGGPGGGGPPSTLR